MARVDSRAEPWVLTMPKIEANRFYTSQWDDLWGFVLDNPIDRYSIGSPTPGLKTAADGSITIYMQAKSPGAAFFQVPDP